MCALIIIDTLPRLRMLTPDESPTERTNCMTATGAQILAQTLVQNGIDTCFANPGTTEMHLLAALGEAPGLGLHLCLFEGGATGAADGHARMTGRPAAVLLHLGPGLANGIANLHNARKAGTPVVVLVGEHATHHLAHDAPLSADIAGLAATVSRFVTTPQTADQAGPLTAQALGRAVDGGVATVIVPNDVAWSPVTAPPDPATLCAPRAAATGFDRAALDDAVRALLAPGAVLLLGAARITRRMADLAQAIAESSGARVFTEAAVARMERGGGTAALSRLPFHVDPATAALADTRRAVLVGARAPVAFFAYPGRPSRLLPDDAETLTLCAPGGDVEGALQALAEAFGARAPAPVACAVPPRYDPAAPIRPRRPDHRRDSGRRRRRASARAGHRRRRGDHQWRADVHPLRPGAGT